MTDKEAMAMAMALDALENIIDAVYVNSELEAIAVKHANIVITALKERLADPMREVQRLGQEIEKEPICPECKAEVLYECVACSSNNYPPPQRTEQDWTPERIAGMARLKAQQDERLGSQRTWVRLTLEQYVAIKSSCTTVEQAVGSTERQLKENNTPQRTEQNFCPRCGKRTKDIHTCTPPQD
jgi:hypothetical protein